MYYLSILINISPHKRVTSSGTLNELQLDCITLKGNIFNVYYFVAFVVAKTLSFISDPRIVVTDAVNYFPFQDRTDFCNNLFLIFFNLFIFRIRHTFIRELKKRKKIMIIITTVILKLGLLFGYNHID